MRTLPDQGSEPRAHGWAIQSNDDLARELDGKTHDVRLLVVA